MHVSKGGKENSKHTPPFPALANIAALDEKPATCVCGHVYIAEEDTGTSDCLQQIYTFKRVGLLK